MRIGITYDLREEHVAAGLSEEHAAELDTKSTVDGLCQALARLGHQPDPIGGLRELMTRVLANERWDLVFNIAEGLAGFGREAQVPAVLDAFGIPYTFSEPLALTLCMHKGMAKRVARDAGIATAPFQVISSAAEATAVEITPPLFVKPVADGSSKGVGAASLVRSREHLGAVTDDLIARFHQPVLVESYLPGREFTVGIVGTGRDSTVIGVMEVELLEGAEPGMYSFANKKHYDDRVRYRLANDPEALQAARSARRLWRTFGCRDCGRVDLRSDGADRPHFLEINPLPGLDPVSSDLPILCRLVGHEYTELIEWILDSAVERLRKQAAPARKLRTAV